MEETHWFTHVLVNAAAQGRSSSCQPVKLPLLSEGISLTESKSPHMLLHGSKSTSALCGQGLDPDVVEVTPQVPSIVGSMRRDYTLSYHLQMSVERPVKRFMFCPSRTLFLLAAAWVDPGRNALQSAEQRC